MNSNKHEYLVQKKVGGKWVDFEHCPNAQQASARYHYWRHNDVKKGEYRAVERISCIKVLA